MFRTSRLLRNVSVMTMQASANSMWTSVVTSSPQRCRSESMGMQAARKHQRCRGLQARGVMPCTYNKQQLAHQHRRLNRQTELGWQLRSMYKRYSTLAQILLMCQASKLLCMTTSEMSCVLRACAHPVTRNAWMCHQRNDDTTIAAHCNSSMHICADFVLLACNARSHHESHSPARDYKRLIISRGRRRCHIWQNAIPK
jgi:hypothetical protein